MIRVAINGYGRIGRCVLRAIHEQQLAKFIDVVAINDLADYSLLAHLTRFDSTHGAFHGRVEHQEDLLSINDKAIRLCSERDPTKLPWGQLGVDIVLECSGKFKTRDQLNAHLEAGAKKVLVSQPAENVDTTVVYGVNHQIIRSSDRVVSNASCTTNCLAPVAQVLHEAFGIVQGAMTTIHAYTNDQNLIDKAPGDMYRSRSATQSMIPTRTGAAAAVGKVLPELDGRLSGMAVRVPTINVSMIDLHAVVESNVSVDAIHEAIEEATNNHLKGVLAINHLPLVSVDFNHNPHSSIFDSNHTAVSGQQIKVMSWYDNEWGFSNRMLDVIKVMHSAGY